MENNINQIIQERRSIYPNEYTGKLLDNKIVFTLLENATYAPNHKLNYPWRFLVLYKPDLEAFFNEASLIYSRSVASEKYNESKFKKILTYSQQVSHVIGIIMHRNPGSNTVLNEDICAVAAAVQNMYLSLSQFPNAGGYWSTGLGTYSDDMRRYLKLNDEETLLGFFILGEVENKRTRMLKKPYTEFIIER